MTDMVRPSWEEFSAQYLFSDPSKNIYVSCTCGETLQSLEQLSEHHVRGHFDRPKGEVALSPEEIDRQLDAMIDALPADDEKKSQPTLPDGVAARSSGPWDLQLFVDSDKGRAKLARTPLPPFLPPIGMTLKAGGKEFRITTIRLNFDERCYEVTANLLEPILLDSREPL